MTHNSNSQTWNRAKLKDLCDEITVGHVGPMAQEYVSEGITFLRSQNILPFHLDLSNVKYITPAFHHRLRKSALKPGDVVVVRTGYPGTACVVPETLRESNCADLVIFRPSKVLDSWFLVALLNSATGRSQIAGALVGVAQQHFNVSAAKDLFVRIPPLPTQRKIADILSAYDDLIENNTRRIQILEEMAQTIYREWFVNFRFPGYENVEMVESELGMIPKGWRVVELSDVGLIVMGQSPSSEFYNLTGQGLPFHQGVTDFGQRFPTDRVYCTVQNRVAEAGDILFSVRAPVGRINLANKRIVVGRGLCAIRSKANCQAFLLQQLKDRFKDEDLMGSGTIFKAVTKDDMHGIELVWPEEELIAGFERLTTPIFAQLANLTDRIKNLRRTRDLLLPKLVSGEVEVQEGVEGSQIEGL